MVHRCADFIPKYEICLNTDGKGKEKISNSKYQIPKDRCGQRLIRIEGLTLHINILQGDAEAGLLAFLYNIL